MLKEKLKSMISGDNLGLTLCFLLFLGPLAYVFFSSVSLAGVISTTCVGYIGFLWGYSKGRDSQKNQRDYQ